MTITINRGECFRISKFTQDQLAKLYEAMVAQAASDEDGDTGESLEYAIRNQERWKYFGIDQRDGMTFTWREIPSAPFTTDITDRLLAHFNEETSMQSNPYPVDTLVVPNGFRYRYDGSTEHRFGTNARMIRWQEEGAVLKVSAVRSNNSVRVISPSNQYASYHPSELRLATPEEAEKYRAEEQPELAVGSIIKRKDTDKVLIVVNPSAAHDGVIRVACVDGTTNSFFRLSHGYTVLGRIMPNGDFRPHGEKATSGPSEWKKGQRVRCTNGDHTYITIGNVYTLVEDPTVSIHGDGMTVRIRDNDGDRSTYYARYFELAE